MPASVERLFAAKQSAQSLPERFTLRRHLVSVSRGFLGFPNLTDQMNRFQLPKPAGQSGRGESSELRLNLVEVRELARRDGIQDVQRMPPPHGDDQRFQTAVAEVVLMIETAAVTLRAGRGLHRAHFSWYGSLVNRSGDFRKASRVTADSKKNRRFHISILLFF